MQANYVQRLRIRFSKVGPTRFIGHLDVARALERALNRSKIPVAYTQGYNPRPRMQFASALPLGFTSEAELADIWLKERMEPAQAQAQMMSRMAPGIVVHEAWEVPLDFPAMQASTLEAVYLVTIDPSLIEAATLQARVAALLEADTCPRERRGKTYDLRPLLLSLSLADGDSAKHYMEMRLMLKPGATGRPDEVVASLGLDPFDVRMHRTQIVLDDDGRLPSRD
jgi:radical SAM-linked protein